MAQRTIRVPADVRTVQAAMDASADGDTVLVGPGTYNENLNFKGKAITVTSSDGAAKTTLDGGGTGQGAVVFFGSAETKASTLNGFTIQNGNIAAASGNGSYGGVLVLNASATITNNVMISNYCSGIAVDGGSAVIDGNIISNTTALPASSSSACPNTFEGSGISLTDNNASTVIRNNTIEKNTGGSTSPGGAGIGMKNASSPLVQNNIIRYNQTLNSGSAITLFNQAGLILVQNVIYGNTVIGAGAALDLHPFPPSIGPFLGVLANNTIANNTATVATGADAGGLTASTQVFLDGGLAQWALVNNMIIGSPGNAAIACGTAFDLSPTPLVFDHNDVWNGNSSAPYLGVCKVQTGVFGNISADPIFADASAGDYHLRRGSPAIDAGNNSVSILLTKDADGLPRSMDASGLGYGTVDIGAYEANGTSNTAGTTLTLTPSSYTFDGTGLDLQASLFSPLGVPTGAITFQRDGVSIGSSPVDGSGKSSLHIASLPQGVYAITATYTGQGSFSPSASVKFYLLVDKTATSVHLASSKSPSLLNQPVTFTVTASSVDGYVPSPITLALFNGQLIATLLPDSSGQATFTTSSLPAGTTNLTATFAGDAKYQSASETFFQQIQADTQVAQISLTATPNPAQYTTPVAIAAAVSAAAGTPAGTVAFSEGANLLGSAPVTNGVAIFTTATLSIGMHNITAAYSGDSNNKAVNGSISVQVTGTYSTKIALGTNANPAQNNTAAGFQVAVTSSTGTPAGTVTFSDGPVSIGAVTLQNGSASFSTATLGLGSHTITATYSGDSLHSGATATIVQQIVGDLPTQIALISSSNPGIHGTPVVFTATATSTGGSTPTGAVTWYDGSFSLGTATLVNGAASISTGSLGVGPHTITATLTPGANFTGASSSIIEIVQGATSTTLLGASSNSVFFFMDLSMNEFFS